jgi:beta-galactosidase/beta-glucuronidase
MVIDYRNHPSIILWGARINESVDDHDFYKEANDLIHSLDPTRQTGGVRCYKKGEEYPAKICKLAADDIKNATQRGEQILQLRSNNVQYIGELYDEG